MAKTKDLRIQNSTPSTPVAGVVALYANPSGVLTTVDENGVTRKVGGYTDSAVTGALNQVTLTGSLGTPAAELSGWIGKSGVYLGLPSIFISVLGSGGATYLVPAYKSV